MEEVSRTEWAENLRQALMDWCNRNGYFPAGAIARELNIDRNAWRGISTGSSISVENKYYARIFFWTELNQADPQTIPPRKYSGAANAVKKQAWEESDYINWLNSEEGKKLALHKKRKFHQNKTEIPFLKPQSIERIPITTSSQNPGEIFNMLLDAVVDKFQKPIRSTANVSMDINSLANNLFQALNPYMTASLEERDILLTKHGNVLAKLAPLVQILSDPNRSSRENSLMFFKGKDG